MCLGILLLGTLYLHRETLLCVKRTIMHGTSTVGREPECLKHVSVYKKQARKEQDSMHGTGTKSGEQACMDQLVCAGNKAAWNDWRASKNKFPKKTPHDLCALIILD